MAQKVAEVVGVSKESFAKPAESAVHMSRELSPEEEREIDERYVQFRKKHGELREECRTAVQSLKRT